jgi:hypothetical protein
LDHADSIRRPKVPQVSSRPSGSGARLRAIVVRCREPGCGNGIYLAELPTERRSPSRRAGSTAARLLWPSVTSAGSAGSVSVRCRFHTCRPVYRGLARIEGTAPSVHAVPGRCGLRPGLPLTGTGLRRRSALGRSASSSARPAAARTAISLRARCPGRVPGGARGGPTPHGLCSRAATASARRYP